MVLVHGGINFKKYGKYWVLNITCLLKASCSNNINPNIKGSKINKLHVTNICKLNILNIFIFVYKESLYVYIGSYSDSE